MLEELAAEHVRGEVRDGEVAPLARGLVILLHLVLREVLLADHVLVHALLRDFPQPDDVGQEHERLLGHHAQPEHDGHHQPEQDVLEHVVLRSEHHGDGEREKERARAADGEDEVELRGEAHLVHRTQRVVDGLVVRALEAFPARGAVLKAVARVLHVLVHLPAVVQLLDVEDEDVHHDLERDDHHAEQQVDDEILLPEPEQERELQVLVELVVEEDEQRRHVQAGGGGAVRGEETHQVLHHRVLFVDLLLRLDLQVVLLFLAAQAQAQRDVLAQLRHEFRHVRDERVQVHKLDQADDELEVVAERKICEVVRRDGHKAGGQGQTHGDGRQEHHLAQERLALHL